VVLSCNSIVLLTLCFRILEGLDNNSRKLLEKTNPNVSAQAKGTASLRAPTMGRSQTAPTRPSIKEAILAQEKSRSNLRTQKSAPIVNEMQPPSEPPAPAAPSGLSTAPVRWHGLKSKALHERQFSDPAAATDGGRAPSPTATSNSGKGSPIGNLRSRTPPPVRMARGVTPGRHQSPLGGNNRKLSILDQLNHSDWKVRVEGTVVVACILAKRTPPGYDGQKLQLPPSDVFAPALVRLFNDPQPEVVENVVAPEVLAELMKVVPLDLIVPKILLLSEGDDHHHAQTIKIKTMPALKQQISDTEATDVLFRVLQNLIPSGGVSSKVAIGSFSTTQKKKIARGCLLWMSELVEGFGNGSSTNEFFSNYSNFKLIVNRLLTMFSVTKLQTRTLLAAVLKGLEKIDSEQFNRILRSLEPATTRDLRKEWGITADEDLEPVVIEEQVAGVEQVLGSIPEIGGTTYQDPLHCVPSTTIARDDNLGVEDKITAIDIPPAARPTTPPAQSAQSIDIIGTVPPLPQTPEQSVDLPSDPITARKVGRIEDKPLIKVYQDPVVESNGAVATSTGTLIVGDEWHRSKLKKQISSNSLPKTPGDSSRLLHTIIGRLQNREMDTQAFRKLIGIARVNPVREPLQEANGDDIHDIWQGGPVFEELLTSLLDYLTADDVRPSSWE
jgi:CLIP-associating protein 1/2